MMSDIRCRHCDWCGWRIIAPTSGLSLRADLWSPKKSSRFCSDFFDHCIRDSSLLPPPAAVGFSAMASTLVVLITRNSKIQFFLQKHKSRAAIATLLFKWLRREDFPLASNPARGGECLLHRPQDAQSFLSRPLSRMQRTK